MGREERRPLATIKTVFIYLICEKNWTEKAKVDARAQIFPFACGWMLAGVLDSCKIPTRCLTLTPPPRPLVDAGDVMVCAAPRCPHLRRTHVVLIGPFTLSACLSPSTTSPALSPPPSHQPCRRSHSSSCFHCCLFYSAFIFFNKAHCLFQISNISRCQLLWMVSLFFPTIRHFFPSFSHLLPRTRQIFLHSNNFWKVFLWAYHAAVTAGCTTSQIQLQISEPKTRLKKTNKKLLSPQVWLCFVVRVKSWGGRTNLDILEVKKIEMRNRCHLQGVFYAYECVLVWDKQGNSKCLSSSHNSVQVWKRCGDSAESWSTIKRLADEMGDVFIDIFHLMELISSPSQSPRLAVYSDAGCFLWSEGKQWESLSILKSGFNLFSLLSGRLVSTKTILTLSS